MAVTWGGSKVPGVNHPKQQAAHKTNKRTPAGSTESGIMCGRRTEAMIVWGEVYLMGFFFFFFFFLRHWLYSVWTGSSRVEDAHVFICSDQDRLYWRWRHCYGYNMLVYGVAWLNCCSRSDFRCCSTYVTNLRKDIGRFIIIKNINRVWLVPSPSPQKTQTKKANAAQIQWLNEQPTNVNKDVFCVFNALHSPTSSQSLQSLF